MKANYWVYLIAFVMLALAGSFLWWQRRHRPERITLSDLPSLQPKPAHRLTEGPRRDGYTLPTAISSSSRQ
jgi:uncharacterized iron-regulated membrane protein